MHEFKLPVVLQDILTEMTNQYQTLDVKYKNRQLDWTNYTSNYDVCWFDQGEKRNYRELVANSIVIIVHSRDDNGYTIEQLSSMTRY